MLPFDRALASVPATEFVERVLVDALAGRRRCSSVATSATAPAAPATSTC